MFLKLEHLSIGYDKPLIKEIHDELSLGQVVLLIGSNGVGKTTLMRTLLGQIPPLEGQLYLNSQPLSSLNAKKIASQIAVVLSKSKVSSSLRLYDLVALGKYIHYPYYIRLSKEDHKEVEQWIESLSLQQYRNHRISELSDGNLQKAFIARALCQNAPFILLDEPTAHLDEENKIMILKLLRRLALHFNKLILFSSHDFRLAKEFSDRIWLLKEKEFYSGLTEDMLLKHQELVRPVLFHLENSFLAPKISAPSLEKELLYSFLQKNFDRDFSSFHFQYVNRKWYLEHKGKQHEFSNFGELKAFLGSF